MSEAIGDEAADPNAGKSQLEKPNDDGHNRKDDGDPDIGKAADLLAQLEQTARGHGFRNFAEMQRRLVEEREEPDPENRFQLLKRLAPALHDADQYAKRRTLPAIDASGLVAIQDIIKSVSRLVRVLLVGYTPDEREELADRIKAERALEVDSAMAQSSAETQHQTALGRISAMACAPSIAGKASLCRPLSAR